VCLQKGANDKRQKREKGNEQKLDRLPFFWFVFFSVTKLVVVDSVADFVCLFRSR
jgi:hypothetical protein